MNSKVNIKQLKTGVPGLDAILGGGLPEFSFNLLSGLPGCGKTTLAHQIMFALATPNARALYFTVLGEPPLKMLRYQQQFLFFDFAKINESIRFVNLSDDLATGDLNHVLARIKLEQEDFGASFVFVDSFRTVLQEAQRIGTDALSLQQFLQQLGVALTSWQATTFLVGQYSDEADSNSVCTVADGLLLLSQSIHRNSMVRSIQVIKMRGQATSPGAHTFRITPQGIEIYPSAPIQDDTDADTQAQPRPMGETRLSMGVLRLDEMLGGGLPSGYSLLVAGPSGSGKTILATAFLSEGVQRGETGVIVAFEQTPSRSRNRTIDDMVRTKRIGLINTRSLDLSIDEIVQRLVEMIHKMKATRVVIDSLSGFELAVAPAFREDFRESLFRMVAVLSGLGVTVLMTSELEDRYTDLRFSPYGTAFLTDAIVVQRYVEIQSRLERVTSVVKVRGSTHSNEIRQFTITNDGIVIGEAVDGYEGLFSGRPSGTLQTDMNTGGLKR